MGPRRRATAREVGKCILVVEIGVTMCILSETLSKEKE